MVCVLAQTALNMIWPLGDSPDGDLRSIWADNAKQSDSLKAIGSTHTHTRGRGRESDGTSMQTDSKYTAVADKYADWQTAASTYWADKNADKQTDTERAPVNMIPLPLAMLIVDMLSFWEG